MEYCNYPTLRTSVNSIEIEEKRALSIMKKLFKAVSYLHSKGIAHRDLTPTNVLLSEDLKEIKLIDFNTAKRFREKKNKSDLSQLLDCDSKITTPELQMITMMTPTGKPFYRAPEISKGCFSEKVDIWSCGLIFLEVLTKRKCKRIKEKDSISPKIKIILSKLLEENYDCRLNANQALNSIEEALGKSSEENKAKC